GLSQNHTITQSGPVPALFFRFGKELQSKEAYQALLDTRYFELFGPYPDDDRDGKEEMVTLLYRPEVSGFDGFRVRADIVHLHTHARVGPKAGGHGELEAVLLFKNKRKIELSVDELTAFEACFQPLPD